MERIAIYNRCSTEEESQINALETQARESREIAEQMGWKVVEQYVESQSGTSADKRKEYLRMLQDIQADRFDIVMIKSIDRLARNVKDWYLFLDCIARNNTKLYLYLDRSFYKSDDALITGIKAILAEEFSKELSKKIKNAHKRRQEKKTGLNISRAMFGWDRTGKDTFVINEEEAAYFRRACTLVEQGLGYRRIADLLYQEGATQKDGKALSAGQWRNMLRSKRACGTVILHQREYDFDTRKYRKIPEEEWVYLENALPPLISREYHDRILGILDQRAVSKYQTESTQPGILGIQLKNSNAHAKNTGKQLLSGKVYCTECGRKYYFSSKVWRCSKYLAEGRKKPDGRGCDNRKISQKEIEEILLECWELHIQGTGVYQRTESIQEKDNWNLFQRNLQEELKKIYLNLEISSSDTKQLKQLEVRLEKIKKNQSLLLVKLLDGIIEDAEYQNYYQRSCEEVQKIQKKIYVIKQQMQKYTNNSVRWMEIERALSDGEVLKKAIVRAFSKKISKIYIEGHGGQKIFLQSGEMYHFDKIL